MKKFLYKTIKRTLDNLMSEVDLNELGMQEWELVGFHIGNRFAVYIFKREL